MKDSRFVLVAIEHKGRHGYVSSVDVLPGASTPLAKWKAYDACEAARVLFRGAPYVVLQFERFSDQITAQELARLLWHAIGGWLSGEETLILNCEGIGGKEVVLGKTPYLEV